MRNVTTATTNAWNNPVKTGSIRPMVRATIARLQVGLVPYDMSKVPEKVTSGRVVRHGRKESGNFASAQFTWNEVPVELPNIKSFTWTRGVGQDIATAQMVIWNTETLPLGTTPQDNYQFDIPGSLSFGRGVTLESQTRWSQSTNGWRNLIAPDRIIRTFEGYGFNASVSPDKDTNLYPSGVWMIDTVEYTSTGTINIAMRDLGRLLVDHICFPPVIPQDAYPLSWSRYAWATKAKVVTPVGGWVRPSYDDDSNKWWYKAGYGSAGVTSSGGVNGHYGPHAFDSSQSTYFMSLPNGVTHGHAWVQGKFAARTVGAVKVSPWNGKYRMYVSLYQAGKGWLGTSRVPHHDGDPYFNDNIAYVFSGELPKNTPTVFQLPHNYTNITKVRISVTHDGTYGGDGQHCGIYDVLVAKGSTTIPSSKYVVGNYGDYTDIIKWFWAWAGGFWPKSTGSQFATINHTDGTHDAHLASTDDNNFPSGAVWGDFEDTGTGGIVDLTVDQFDKKTLLDCVGIVRDIIGWQLWFDEQGGLVWRSPNIWSVGNVVSNPSGGPNLGRTSSIVQIADDTNLMGLSVKLDSTNTRERIFVAVSTGQYGGVASGIFSDSAGPFQSGLRRVGGYTDQNFASAPECQIMADLISVRAMFTYRTTTLTIPGNPAIQIDDQVQILERVTSETYLHYVTGITSKWDAQSGQWTYDLTTHWLGATPFTDWAFNPKQLSADTQLYLRSIGKI